MVLAYIPLGKSLKGQSATDKDAKMQDPGVEEKHH